MWKPTFLFTTLLSGVSVALPWAATGPGSAEYTYYYHHHHDDEDTYRPTSSAKSSNKTVRRPVHDDSHDGYDYYERRRKPEWKAGECDAERCSCRG